MCKMLCASLAVVALLNCTGCHNVPATSGNQGTIAGGLGGTTSGAAIGSEHNRGAHNRVLGVLLGGSLGAGAGYVVGANSDMILGRDHAAATQATQKAETNPATPQDVRNSNTADLNHDGFVTMDEVAAMKAAGLSDDQMLQRLRATDQVFELTAQQQQYLRDHGVDQTVISQMENINLDKRQQILSSQSNLGAAPGYTNTNPGATHPISTYPTVPHPNAVPPGPTAPITTSPDMTPSTTIYTSGPTGAVIGQPAPR
ncbi:hypothetical protein [Pedosphaera parvula]|uniref:EF-hand domain-containing protein n=1 Tax=Pedosphaera parvula (strain Ellin514) TaxID=320771 RepID=B9XN38_PEDPL|nr:hypothetical protein [Pedosphaera parvula]EEF58700.1 hypothetical protein Cflav_PD1796 [Pedosphaera parvula Ellin514]